MNNDFILKSLMDSFEILKAKWSSKREAITLCISEMTKYDIDIAFDMWLYILKNNTELLKQDRDSEYLVSELIDHIVETIKVKYDMDEDLIFIKIIVPQMLKRKEFFSLIYGNTYRAGARSSSFNDWMPTCLAYTLFVANPDDITNIMKLMSCNKQMKEVSVGTFLMRAINELKTIIEDNDIVDTYSISGDAKMALLSSLDFISDLSEKAECTVAVM